MSRLRKMAGRPVASAPLPPTQTINWGAKTRTGFGAHLCGYTGVGTLSIVSQKDASNATVTIWQMGQNALSWKGASSSYDSAPPSSLNGPYTVVITDGTYSSTITINIQATVAHIREMTAVAQGGRWATDSMYKCDFSGQPFPSRGFQLADMTDRTTSSVPWIAKGDSIVGRDGQFNPTNIVAGMVCFNSTKYSGSGRITITSETVDSTLDSFGYPNNQHGFKINQLEYSVASTDGTGDHPFDFQSLWFYSPVVLSGNSSLMKFVNGAEQNTVNFYDCRFETVSTLTPTQFKNTAALAQLPASSTVDGCRFIHVGQGVQAKGDNVVLTNNVLSDICDGDGFQIGVGGTGYHNATITDNVGWNLRPDFSVPPLQQGHPDWIQFIFLTSNGFMGTIKRNIFLGIEGQGLFNSDGTAPNKFTGATVENNIFAGGLIGQIAVSGCDDINTSWNTLLNSPNGTPSGSYGGQYGLAAGNNATVKRIVANSYDYALGSPPVPQTGTITKTPTTPVTLTRTLVAYQVAFPNYIPPELMTDFSLAAMKACYTPDATWFNGVGASSGALKPDGTWNDVA